MCPHFFFLAFTYFNTGVGKGESGVDQDYDKDQSELILFSSTALASHLELSPHICQTVSLQKDPGDVIFLLESCQSISFPRVTYISKIISNVD